MRVILINPYCYTPIMRHSESNDSIRVVGYVRVSTEKQEKEGYSIEAQKQAIENYAKSQGWTIEKWYEDRGKSAYQNTQRRDGFKALYDDIDSWDIVIAKWLNRFFRRIRPALEFVEYLKQRDSKMVCVVDKIDMSSAMGQALMEIMLVFAKLESAQTSERIIDARKQKFNSMEKDAWATRPPYGYDMDKKRLSINETEAEGVRLAFQLALRHTHLDIALGLNQAGYRTKPTRTSPEGKPFTQYSVSHLIHNPAYCGYVYRNGVLRRNHHPAVIEDDLFNQVQKACISRRRGKFSKDIPPLEVGQKEIHVIRKKQAGAYYLPLDPQSL